MDDPAFEERASGERAAFDRYRHIFDLLHVLGREAVGFRAVEHAVLLARNRALVGTAKPDGRFDQRVQHRPQVEGRAADNLERVGGRGLLL